MVGKLNPDGRFDVVWRSISPIKPSVWSRYIPVAPGNTELVAINFRTEDHA